MMSIHAVKPDEETKGGDDGTDGKKEEASKKAKCGTSSSTPRTVRVSPSRSQSGRSWSPGPGVSGGGNDARDQKDGSSTTGVLHRGEMLGELPALGRAPPGNILEYAFTSYFCALENVIFVVRYPFSVVYYKNRGRATPTLDHTQGCDYKVSG